MKFKEFINEVDPFMFNESLDSSFEIIKKDKDSESSTIRYYIDVNGKEYRIFIENVENHLHIGFERFIKNKWTLEGFTNDLNPKEILALFGTIKNLLLKQKFKSINVSTNEMKKYGLYRRMLQKLQKELNKSGYNFKYATNDIFDFLYTEEEYKPPKFRYKK